jgi:hypothetical protein
MREGGWSLCSVHAHIEVRVEPPLAAPTRRGAAMSKGIGTGALLCGGG